MSKSWSVDVHLSRFARPLKNPLRNTNFYGTYRLRFPQILKNEYLFWGQVSRTRSSPKNSPNVQIPVYQWPSLSDSETFKIPSPTPTLTICITLFITFRSSQVRTQLFVYWHLVNTRELSRTRNQARSDPFSLLLPYHQRLFLTHWSYTPHTPLLGFKSSNLRNPCCSHMALDLAHAF